MIVKIYVFDANQNLFVLFSVNMELDWISLYKESETYETDCLWDKVESMDNSPRVWSVEVSLTLVRNYARHEHHSWETKNNKYICERTIKACCLYGNSLFKHQRCSDEQNSSSYSIHCLAYNNCIKLINHCNTCTKSSQDIHDNDHLTSAFLDKETS